MSQRIWNKLRTLKLRLAARVRMGHCSELCADEVYALVRKDVQEGLREIGDSFERTCEMMASELRNADYMAPPLKDHEIEAEVKRIKADP